VSEPLAERPPPEMFLSEMNHVDETLASSAPARAAYPAKPAPLLSLQAATTRLPGRRIGPFTFELRAGERIAILGASGAGKSTLLKLMAGERAPHEGQVALQGRALADWPLPALARRRAVLPQSHAVAFGLPVELVVGLGRVAREPDSGQSRIVAQSLELARAGHLVGRRFDTLSGGEQARVQLARVFAQLWDERECLLLVDEPLAALDPGLQFELMDALQAFCAARAHALAAVLHDINQALAAFDRLWLLREGSLVADIASGRAAVAPLEALYGIGLRCVEGDGGGLAVVPVRRAATAASMAATTTTTVAA
jgi:iron complex transport system ATP-binding protein